MERGLSEPSIMSGLIFSDENNVIPDVIWVSTERLAQIQNDTEHLRGAPELVVEVLSPGKANEERDRSAKLKLYSIQGVHECWIVNRIAQHVEMYRRSQTRLVRSATLCVNDTITSPLLPGFKCNVGSLFRSQNTRVNRPG